MAFVFQCWRRAAEKFALNIRPKRWKKKFGFENQFTWLSRQVTTILRQFTTLLRQFTMLLRKITALFHQFTKLFAPILLSDYREGAKRLVYEDGEIGAKAL